MKEDKRLEENQEEISNSIASDVVDSRTAEQDAIINDWSKVYRGNGILEAATGFGKTRVGSIIAKKAYEASYKYLDYDIPIIVVVPSTVLQKTWESVFESMGLSNVVKVNIVNTHIKYSWNCALLIADEIHRYLSEDALYFNLVLRNTKRKHLIGLSATLNKEEKSILNGFGIPIIRTITALEAEKKGWIAPTISFNLKVYRTEKEQEDYDRIEAVYESSFSKFALHDMNQFDLAMACGGGNNKTFRVKILEPIDAEQPWLGYSKVDKGVKTSQAWRMNWAKFNKWDGNDNHQFSPKNIQKYSHQFTWALRERKMFLYNMDAKVDKIVELINKLPDNKNIIIFSESTSFADKTADKLGEIARAYHSKLKTRMVKEANGKMKKYGVTRLRRLHLEEFESEDSPVRVLCTARALDEGFNVEKINIAIMASYTSTERQHIQRKGRAGRIDYTDLNKIAVIINLYVPDTQEEKWLKKKQASDRRIIEVEDVNDIVNSWVLK